MIKAVILDFDGTLCMTLDSLFELQNIALSRMGREPIDYSVMKKTFGMILPESMKLRSPGVDFGAFKKTYDEVQAEYAEKGLVDIVPEENLRSLTELRKAGIYLAIVTSRSQQEVQHLLNEKHSLSVHIKDVYHKDNTDYHKPDPRVFDRLLADTGFKPSECVYVGDMISDGIATNGAGMKFVASLESGDKTKADFAGCKVDAFISKFAELPKAIRLL